MVDWGTVGTVIGIFTAIIGLGKYIGYIFEKQNQHIDKQFGVVNGRFKDHSVKISSNAEDIKKQAERISTTREDMKENYVKHDHLNEQMNDLRETTALIFERLNNIDSNLNQLIGAHNGKVGTGADND